ncbi:MAG: hypothetical protein AB1453_12085 [Chloroflexota bacterium]
MSDQIKAWKCPKGHAMGQVMRNGSGVRVLLLYRQALPDGEGEVDVMAVVEGYAADVRCSLCGSVRTWVPGEEQLQALVERLLQLRNST